ncbi:MAG: hypothetical protein IAF02_06150 [Anaerolineae bacterium]|nr:hypothetical protein [Anaerolineae bacterium]
MSNFEWRQEDGDGDWDERPFQSAPESPKSRRRFAVVILILFALVTAGFVLYRQVNDQLQQTETAIQADILASHNLIQTAAQSQDKELLLSVLSGRLPSWTDAQQEALAAGVLYDRTPWGLPFASDSIATLAIADLETDAQLLLTSDLREAELHFPLTYQFTTTTGISETIVLSQTAVYRQGMRTWLLSPPDTEFWGNWQTNEGERLTLIYPERDKLLAEKLAFDLEQILQQLCTDPDLPDCAEDVTYTIRLDTHPESLVNAMAPRDLLDGEPYLTLPAPTLFGLPTDEAAYEALVQAYSVPLATAVFADLFGWECCLHPAIFQTLVEYQLGHMGIMAWPITTADHVQALRDGLSFSSLSDYWRTYQSDEPDTSTKFLQIAFDFMFRQYPDLSPPYLLSNIRERGDMAFWLSDGFNQTGYQLGSVPDLWQTLQSEWWQFAYTETLLAQEKEELPIPLPTQDIALACLSDENFDRETTMTLYQFNRDKESWQELMTSNSFILFDPFLDDNGLVIQSLDLDETNQWQTQIWAFDGEQTWLSSDEKMTFFSFGQFDPTGRFVITFAGENESPMMQPTLIDLQSCAESACDLLPLPGLPTWSPDGKRTLISNKNIFDAGGIAFWRNGRMVIFDATQPPAYTGFWLGDALGQLPAEKAEVEVIGNGYSPFWLDNDTYGYVRQHPETGDAEVVVQSVTGDALETVVTLAEIQAKAPDKALALANIRYVITHPAHPDKLFVVALDALGQEAYVFMVDRVTGDLNLRIQSKIQLDHSLGFSPNGRWLVLTGYQDEAIGRTTNFIVLDLENNETQTYTSNLDGLTLTPLYDWSADGNWLLFVINNRVLSMVAPEYKYQLVQLHNQGYCPSIAWINR